MTDQQITALAREYAEEVHHGNTVAVDRAIEVIRFLHRRYCLVEKSKVKQFFQSRQNILSHQNEYDRYIVDEASAEKRLMLCLFPEIAKEVE